MLAGPNDRALLPHEGAERLGVFLYFDVRSDDFVVESSPHPRERVALWRTCASGQSKNLMRRFFPPRRGRTSRIRCD